VTIEQSVNPKHPVRIRDARGRKVAQLDPVTMHFLRQYHAIDPDTLDALADDIGPGYRKAQTRFFWLFEILPLLAIPLGFAWLFFIRGGRDLVGITLWMFILAAVVIAFTGYFHAARRKRFDRVKHAMLKRRRCPHCGYDLRDLPVDADDGATLCPECGCAWKLTARGAVEGQGHAIAAGNSGPQRDARGTGDG